MKVKAKDLKPGMMITVKYMHNQRLKVSNLKQCPQCHTPNCCKKHSYAYMDYIKNWIISMSDGDENVEVEFV